MLRIRYVQLSALFFAVNGPTVQKVGRELFHASINSGLAF
jgi:hypothetical protein